MSKQVFGIKRYSALALLAILVFAVTSTNAQTSPTTPAETSTVLAAPATTGPISHTFTLSKIDGKLNILVNPDGKWLFSGSSPKKFLDKDFDVSLALKNSSGAIILFEWCGNASNGIQFSKEGTSRILKENFASFASGHHMAWDYRFTETAAGRAKLYEERMKKKEALKDAALKQEEQEELSADYGTPVTNLNVTKGQEKSYDEWRAEMVKTLPLKCPTSVPSPSRHCLLQADRNVLGYQNDSEAEQFEKLPPALQKETGAKAYALQQKVNKEEAENARKQQAQQAQSGGGGTSVGSVLSTVGEVAGVIGTVLSFL
ncbi:MAG: hypothetical protein ACLPXT_05320 [Terracidiphilus sp.]